MRGRTNRLPWRLPAIVALAVVSGLVLGYLLALPETGRQAVSGVVFAMCGQPPHDDCVIDGDTFYMRDQSIRIADIDTPETHQPRCAFEADLGAQATVRLLALLNAGPFTMERIERDEDRYGRKLRIVVRDGHSLGDVLVSEGLARTWTGRRMPWCD